MEPDQCVGWPVLLTFIAFSASSPQICDITTIVLSIVIFG